MLKTKLYVFVEFEASHSLDTVEQPHSHLWKTKVTFEGQPVRGRVIDLPKLEGEVERHLAFLTGSYLNVNEGLPEAARAFPTCETLARAFFDIIDQRVVDKFKVENPSLAVSGVEVELWDNQKLFGAASVERVA